MRPPAKKAWQHLYTNVNVPKRLRSGPVAKQQKNGHTVEHLESNPRPEPIKLKKKTNTKRGQWSEGDMQLALEAIVTKKMSIMQAGEYYGISLSNIQDSKKGKTTSKTIGHQIYLTKVEELVVL